MSISNDHVDCEEHIRAGSDCQLFQSLRRVPLSSRTVSVCRPAGHTFRCRTQSVATLPPAGRIGHGAVSEQLTVADMAGGNLKEKQENEWNRSGSAYTLQVEEPKDWGSIPVNVEEHVERI